MNKQEFAEYVVESYNQNPNGNFDRFGREYIQNGSFNIRVVLEEESNLTWGESYIGTGFGTTVDYGDTHNKLKEGEIEKSDLESDVRERIGRNPRQINFIEKEDGEVVRVYTGVVVIVRQNGYAIYPDPDETVEI